MHFRAELPPDVCYARPARFLGQHTKADAKRQIPVAKQVRFGAQRPAQQRIGQGILIQAGRESASPASAASSRTAAIGPASRVLT